MVALIAGRYQAAKEIATHPRSWRIAVSTVAIVCAGLSIVLGVLSMLAFYSQRYAMLALPVGLVGLALGNAGLVLGRLMRHRRLFLQVVGLLTSSAGMTLAFVGEGGVPRAFSDARRALIEHHPEWLDFLTHPLSLDTPLAPAEMVAPADETPGEALPDETTPPDARY